MVSRVVQWLDAEIGIACWSENDRALLRERAAALAPQMPWLYGVLLANLGGLAFAFHSMPAALFAGAALAGGFLSLRPRRHTDFGAVQHELRRTYLVGALYFVVIAAWELHSFFELPRESRPELAIFGALGAIGASASLSSFPAAAKLALSLVGFPFGCLLTASPRPVHQGIGISLIVIILLRLRILNVQDGIFARLVNSNLAIEAEKSRALIAEQNARDEQRRVATIANSDPLTGLPNRRGFLEAQQAIPAQERRKLALIFLDLDGFKPINDTFGHLSGDSMLIEVSRRLEALAGTDTLVARLGGDEFALLRKCEDSAEALCFARRAVEAVSQPYRVQRRTMRISACAGISCQGEADVGEAMRRADIALYSAKRSGRGSASVFSVEMEQEVQRRTTIEQALHRPGLANSVELSFQPIYELETMELRSFEALARWRHPELGWISPAEFIPISEQTSLLHKISRNLLHRAAAAARDWPETVRLSFNLSPVQLCSLDTAENVLSIIDQERIHPRRLQIEVTETALLADFEAARQTLSTLSRAGVKIALDDFGAGYSSISYLREMNFDTVKLDGSLITTMTRTANGLALLQGVLALCRSMGQECIAEHIETSEQFRLLRQLGCNYGQGYHLSPALDAESAAQLASGRELAAQKRRAAG